MNPAVSGDLNLLMSMVKTHLEKQTQVSVSKTCAGRQYVLCSSPVSQGAGGAAEAVGRAGAAAEREHPTATQAARTGRHRALPESPSTSFSEATTMSVVYLTHAAPQN